MKGANGQDIIMENYTGDKKEEAAIGLRPGEILF
jgi:hypothetical protein